MTDSDKQIKAQQREMPDPYESNRPIPLAVLAVVAIVLSWAIGYIVFSKLGNEPELGDRRTVADLTGKGSAARAAVDGARIFSLQCIACHQATGLGLPGVFPPLADSEWVNGKEAVAVQILLHGISGSLTVKGTAYKGDMPAFKNKLGDAELAAVLTYARSSFGNAANKVDAALVKAEREATKDRAAPWNGDSELSALR
jgi:mono/diheme cytochrome c family protein